MGQLVLLVNRQHSEKTGSSKAVWTELWRSKLSLCPVCQPVQLSQHYYIGNGVQESAVCVWGADNQFQY